MNRLAPNLFDRRFADFVAIARSKLPSLAPEWTDHNAHDPGITLIELLSWIAEAQLYSLARTRRDERAAYAALMGLAANGPRPARGLIWPDTLDPSAPASLMSRALIIERDAAIQMTNGNEPAFRPSHRMLFVPARIRALTSQLADGIVVDQTDANRRGGPAFLPFGESGEPGNILSLELVGSRDAPLLPVDRPDDAYLTIGVRAPASQDVSGAVASTGGVPLEVALLSGTQQHALRVVQDTSAGFTRTGVCILDISAAQVATNSITLKFRAPRGFERRPRVLRIEPNVLPMQQQQQIERERHIARGEPAESFDLETPGLAFEPGTDPVDLQVAEGSAWAQWSRCDRLADCGPDDRVYELDPVAARVTFGNGVNGRMPPAEAQVIVSYAVCAGAGGNTARNRKWTVHGFSGVYGSNLDPIAGGQDASGWVEQRREARRRAGQSQTLVSGADIEAAECALPLLEVARAWVVPAPPRPGMTGTIRLIALQARPSGEPADAPETPRWLEGIRRRLAPHMPLGLRLVVDAPRYVDFSLSLRIEVEPKCDPAAVKRGVEEELRRRLALTSDKPRLPPRPFGVPVTRRDVIAWVQSVPDVRRVADLTIRLANGRAADQVDVRRDGLPRFSIAQSTIEVARGASGDAR